MAYTANSIASSTVHKNESAGIARHSLASDSKYTVRLANSPSEVVAALRLRHEVFIEELEIDVKNNLHLEFDAFDFRSEHLLAIEGGSDSVIGTYRINSLSAHEDLLSLYSHQEFDLNSLPRNIIINGVEIGRACITRDHRNSRALLLMWKALARYLVAREKRYFFGCCSILTREPNDGAKVYQQLMARDAIHRALRLMPKRNAIDIEAISGSSDVELPHLFEMYLRLGAKVCGPPMYDTEFGSVDFFVLFDLEQMNDRYRRMFFN